MERVFNVVANCRVQLYQKEIFTANFFQQIFQNWLPMKPYNNLFCKASQTYFSKALYQSSKISPFSARM